MIPDDTYRRRLLSGIKCENEWIDVIYQSSSLLISVNPVWTKHHPIQPLISGARNRDGHGGAASEILRRIDGRNDVGPERLNIVILYGVSANFSKEPFGCCLVVGDQFEFRLRLHFPYSETKPQF